MSFFTYNIKYSNYGDVGAKPSIIIEPMDVNTSTSLRLPGQGKTNYGEFYNQNLLFLMEHFANDTPPPNPTPGQIWYQPYVLRPAGNTPSIPNPVCDTDYDIEEVIDSDCSYYVGDEYVIDEYVEVLCDTECIYINQYCELDMVNLTYLQSLTCTPTEIDSGKTTTITRTYVYDCAKRQWFERVWKYKLRYFTGEKPNEDSDYPGWSVIQSKLTTPPTEPSCGDIYFNILENQFYFWKCDATRQKWEPLAGNSGGGSLYYAGDGIVISSANTITNIGVLSVNGKTGHVTIDEGTNNNPYTLPVASASILGGVKVGSGLTMTNDVLSNSGVTSVNGMTGAVTISPGGTYTLPTASASTLGGIKVGSGLSINSGVLSASGVTKIIAGTNVTISPTTGVGEVTINASGGGSSGTTMYSAGTGINISTANQISVKFGTSNTTAAAGDHTHLFKTELLDEWTFTSTNNYDLTRVCKAYVDTIGASFKITFTILNKTTKTSTANSGTVSTNGGPYNIVTYVMGPAYGSITPVYAYLADNTSVDDIYPNGTYKQTRHMFNANITDTYIEVNKFSEVTYKNGNTYVAGVYNTNKNEQMAHYNATVANAVSGAAYTYWAVTRIRIEKVII